MKSITQWLMVLLLTILGTGCKNKTIADSAKDVIFNNLYSNCELNSKIRFLPSQNDYKSGSLITLNVSNNSQDSIIFPDDFNVRILYFESNEHDWLEIKNDIQYVSSPDPYSIMKPANTGLASYSVILLKPIPPSEIPVEARVVIFGHVYKEDQKMNECVGAFVDISISP